MQFYNKLKGKYEEFEIPGSDSVEDMEGQWRRFDEKMYELEHPLQIMGLYLLFIGLVIWSVLCVFSTLFST